MTGDARPPARRRTDGRTDANWSAINRVYVIARCAARHWLRQRGSDVIAGATSLAVDESCDHRRGAQAPTPRRSRSPTVVAPTPRLSRRADRNHVLSRAAAVDNMFSRLFAVCRHILFVTRALFCPATSSFKKRWHSTAT